METTPQNRSVGALLGLAAGDALGTTAEFKVRDSFPPVEDMVGGGVFDLKPGQWTDDTSMALCLAASLIECAEFDASDQMRRYVRWYREGIHSSTGACFDIGCTIRAALERFEATGEPYAGSTHPRTAGNGSLMRLAPIPIRYQSTPGEAIEFAARMCRTTHGAIEAIDASRYFSGLLVGALRGIDKQTLLADRFHPSLGTWPEGELCARIEAVAEGTYRLRRREEIGSDGYVVHSLEAALWAFFNTESFEPGALLAVNLGHDADTVGAIYGQLAGAHYGEEQIPSRWRSILYRGAEIVAYAEQLHAMADCGSTLRG